MRYASMRHRWPLRTLDILLLACPAALSMSCTAPNAPPPLAQGIAPDAPTALLIKALQTGDPRATDPCLPDSMVDLIRTPAESQQMIRDAVQRAITYAHLVGINLSHATFTITDQGELKATATGRSLWMYFHVKGAGQTEPSPPGLAPLPLEQALLLDVDYPTPLSPEERRSLRRWRPGEDSRTDERWARLLVERRCPDTTLARAAFTDYVSSDIWTRPCSRETLQKSLTLQFASPPTPDRIDAISIKTVAYGGWGNYHLQAKPSQLIETGRATLLFQERDYAEWRETSPELAAEMCHQLALPAGTAVSLADVDQLTVTLNGSPRSFVRVPRAGLTFHSPLIEILESREQRLVQFHLTDGIVTAVTFPVVSANRPTRPGLLFQDPVGRATTRTTNRRN